MRSIRTALGITLAALLVSGCVRGQARYAAYAGEVVLTGVGLAIATQVDPDGPSSDDQLDLIGDFRPTAIGIGWLMFAGGVFGFLTTFALHDQADEPAPPTFDPTALPALPDRPSADPDAVRLTRQARRAAVARMCDAVQQLAPRVKLADRHYFRTVFEPDPAIASCL